MPVVKTTVIEYTPKQSVLLYPYGNIQISEPTNGDPCAECDCYTRPLVRFQQNWAGRASAGAGADDAAHSRGTDYPNIDYQDWIGFGDPQDHEWVPVFPNTLDGGEI